VAGAAAFLLAIAAIIGHSELMAPTFNQKNIID
jgi:hypothetical protein